MIHHYLESASYRAKFGFPKEIEELILVPNGYDCNLPVARMIFSIMKRIKASAIVRLMQTVREQ